MNKYRLTVGGRTHDVEIENLDAAPIVVRIDGERYEVSRESAAGPVAPAAQLEAAQVSAVPAAGSRPSPTGGGGKSMAAPMPGTVLEIKVRPGDKVAYGDEVGVLEAMKMKSSLRAERAGTIAEVRVVAGQSVAHGDVLVVFE